MELIKEDLYRENQKKLFEYFQYNFRTEKEGSHPSQYDYKLNEIPGSYLVGVDVYSKAGQFLRRYLLVAVIGGTAKDNPPEAYSKYLDLLCELPNPLVGAYGQGIAMLFVDNNIEFPELILQSELRMVDCGT